MTSNCLEKTSRYVNMAAKVVSRVREQASQALHARIRGPVNRCRSVFCRLPSTTLYKFLQPKHDFIEMLGCNVRIVTEYIRKTLCNLGIESVVTYKRKHLLPLKMPHFLSTQLKQSHTPTESIGVAVSSHGFVTDWRTMVPGWITSRLCLISISSRW